MDCCEIWRWNLAVHVPIRVNTNFDEALMSPLTILFIVQYVVLF